MNYKNGKIYNLVSFQTDKVYVGSTTQSLSRRKSKHKMSYNCWLNGNYHYVSSFELIKYNDCDIILLEEYPCENKMELHKREREWIEKLNCVNKVIPTRTKKEHYKDNKEDILKKQKQYYKDNKEDVLLQHKQYYEDNKEDVLKKQKQYALKNKEHKKEYDKTRQQKINCECGGRYTICHRAGHFRTKKHQEYVKNII